MCTFDAPISRCEVMRVMVITDQTQHQCSVEHCCAENTVCPLADCFSGVEIPATVSKKPESGWRIAA